MAIADENSAATNASSSVADQNEVDLKCAEKVTDSDVEESNLDSEDSQKIKVLSCIFIIRCTFCVMLVIFFR